MWPIKKIQLNNHYNILLRIWQKKARSQIMISLLLWEGVLIVANIWKLSFRPPGTPRVLVNVKSTGVRFQLRPPRQLSTTLRHFISPPGLSLVKFKIREPEKSCGKKEQDTNGFRWTKFHIFRSAKNDINIAVNCDPMQKYIFDWSPAGCDYQLRLILVGESTVGKTSLIRSPDHVVHKPEFQTIYGIKWTKH